MPFPAPIRAVLLDMDGTLLDTENVYAGAMLAAVAEMGHVLPDAVVHGMVGLPGKECIDILHRTLGAAFDLPRFRVVYAGLRDARLDAGIPLKPGVIELLDHLAAAGLPHVVATAATRTSAEANLARAGLLSRFSAVLTRDDVTQTKPHPELFLLAARTVGFPPKSCVAIEDSHVGVRSAQAAGAMTIMVPDMLPATEEMHRLCVAVVPDLHAVRALLDRRV